MLIQSCMVPKGWMPLGASEWETLVQSLVAATESSSAPLGITQQALAIGFAASAPQKTPGLPNIGVGLAVVQVVTSRIPFGSTNIGVSILTKFKRHVAICWEL